MHALGLLCLGHLLVFLNLAAAAPQNAPTLLTADSADSTNYGLNGRIVNGEKAALRQFPHQVSLRRSWSMNHFCGGGIISESHVLTASHCMFQNGEMIRPWTIVVVAGQLQLSMPSSTSQKRGVIKILKHPDFEPETLRNDVTILQLSVPFTMTLEVNKAPVAFDLPGPGTFCQISGWGYPAEDVPITNNDLMYVDLPVVHANVCRELLVNVTLMPPGTFCAGYLEGGKDACQGDSGGSMICNGEIAGIVSGGDGCARPRLPGLYADVSFYKDWIAEQATVYSKENAGRNTTGLHSASLTLITTLLLLMRLST